MFVCKIGKNWNLNEEVDENWSFYRTIEILIISNQFLPKKFHTKRRTFWIFASPTLPRNFLPRMFDTKTKIKFQFRLQIFLYRFLSIIIFQYVLLNPSIKHDTQKYMHGWKARGNLYLTLFKPRYKHNRNQTTFEKLGALKRAIWILISLTSCDGSRSTTHIFKLSMKASIRHFIKRRYSIANFRWNLQMLAWNIFIRKMENDWNWGSITILKLLIKFISQQRRNVWT